MASDPLENIGLKIVDQDAQVIAPLVDLALGERRPLEIGWYFADPATHALLRKRLGANASKINSHIDQRVLGVYRAAAQRDVLAAHIDFARQFGSRYSIIHLSHVPMTVRTGRHPQLFARLLPDLLAIEAVCAAHDYALYIENTYHDLPFYRALFELICEHGLSRVHFCFDLGHAKVWSTQTIDAWAGFLDQLVTQGRRLHFHWHINEGFYDQHLSLGEAAALGLIGADGDYLRQDLFQTLAMLQRRFPDSHKVFEVKGQLAVANLREALAGIQARGGA